jgi:hypothetical protein
VLINYGVFRFISRAAPRRINPIVHSKADHFSVFYVLNIFIVENTSANHRNLYHDVATKLLVAIAITCAFAVALTFIAFPSSTGVIQDIFAQITPASLGNDNGTNTTNSSILTSNTTNSSILTSNTTNSSSIIQLATLSSYQPITPSSYSGGPNSNDNEDGEDDETQDTNYSDGDDGDNSNYDDDNNNDNDDDNNNDNDDDNNNGNTIIITSTGSYDSEDDNEDTSSISIGSGGAFASAGGGGGSAFASVG